MIKYMIVEDENILGYRLERMISQLRPSWQLVCRTAGVEESIEALKIHDPDLIFMDIELSDGNCFEIFDNMQVRQPVIFTTAYDEYALQAFRTNSIDYLLKPVTKVKLSEALDKLERLSGFPHKVPDYKALREKVRLSVPKDRLLIPEGTGFIFVNMRDVACFVKNDRYTEVITFDSHRHLIDKSLDWLEEETDPGRFFRTSRSSIVCIDAIVSIQRYGSGRLRLITRPSACTDIMVSQARREDFLLWIEGGAKKEQ